MKSIAVALAFVFVSPAWSQGAEPKPAAEQATPKAKPAALAGHRSRRHEDARRCLEQPSNSAIIKCAEAYL